MLIMLIPLQLVVKQTRDIKQNSHSSILFKIEKEHAFTLRLSVRHFLYFIVYMYNKTNTWQCGDLIMN